MDRQLLDFMRANTPEFNKEITHGVAAAHMENAEAYIDEMFQAVAKVFPPSLEYLGPRPFTPDMEYAALTSRKMRNGRKRAGKQGSMHEIDIAETHTYTVNYMMRYKGVEISVPVNIPIIKEGGILYISGTRYVISPVIADQVITFEHDNIFLMFSRQKLHFRREPGVTYYEDDTLKIVDMPYAQIHNEKPKRPPKIRAKTSMMFYLLAKYGLSDTFKRFCNSDVRYINKEDYDLNKYPTDKWVVCQSAQVGKLRDYLLADYVPPNTLLLVDRTSYEDPLTNNMVTSMVGSFFYIVNRFHHRILPEFVDNLRLWRVLLGLALWGDSKTEGEMHDEIVEHLGSLDEYVDERRAARFRRINLTVWENGEVVPVTNIYQFFMAVIDRMTIWLLQSQDSINSLYEKELSVLYYVFYYLMTQINNFYFALKPALRREQSAADIKRMLSGTIRTNHVYLFTRKMNSASTVTSPNSQMAFRLTTIMVPQTSSSKEASARSGNGNDPSRLLHASNAEIGTFCILPKSDPSAGCRINPAAHLNSRGVFVRNPRFLKLLDSVQAKLNESGFRPTEERDAEMNSTD